MKKQIFNIMFKMFKILLILLLSVSYLVSSFLSVSVYYIFFHE